MKYIIILIVVLSACNKPPHPANIHCLELGQDVLSVKSQNSLILIGQDTTHIRVGDVYIATLDRVYHFSSK